MERVDGSVGGRLAALGVSSRELATACEAVPPRIARYLLGLGEAMAVAGDAPERRVGLVRALLALRERFDGGDHALLSQLSHVGKWMATGPGDRAEVVGRLATLEDGVLCTPLLDDVFAAGLDPLTVHARLDRIEAAGRLLLR